MLKKTILTSVLFIFLFSIFMIVNLPASWIYKQFLVQKTAAYPIQVQHPQGTIWQGHTSIATQPNLPISAYIPRISWSFQYGELLSLKFIYKIHFESVEAVGKKLGNYHVLAGIDFTGIIFQAQDESALLELKVLGDFNSTPAIIRGKVNVRGNDPELSNLLGSIPQIRKDGTFSLPINL